MIISDQSNRSLLYSDAASTSKKIKSNNLLVKFEKAFDVITDTMQDLLDKV